MQPGLSCCYSHVHESVVCMPSLDSHLLLFLGCPRLQLSQHVFLFPHYLWTSGVSLSLSILAIADSVVVVIVCGITLLHSNKVERMQRAEQCEKVAPVAAYFTRFAGMKKCLEFDPMHPDIKGLCMATMSRLERDKAHLGIAGETDPSKNTQQIEELRAFALTVFGNADRTDQLGARDGKLVLKYMAAGSFLQALAAVRPGGLAAKEEELLKYCRVRSVEISRAIRTASEVPPPRASAAPDAGAVAAEADVDLDAELAAIGREAGIGAAAACTSAPAASDAGGAGSSGRPGFTAEEARLASMREHPPHVPSWNDLPSAPPAEPPKIITDPLPSIFTRGARLLLENGFGAHSMHG